MISNNNKNNEDGESWRDYLRKGPWTPREDAILIEQVKKWGKGNWSLIRKNSELRRSGKSCRLRWSNHLNPDLKKGPFSEEEEKTIDDLHAKFGNKWALMATQIPGRSDNDIKNFWNSRMKKRLREYPPQITVQQAQHFSSSPFYSVLASCYPKNNFSVELPSNISAANPPPNHNQKQLNQNNSSSSSSFSCTNNNASFVLPLTPVSPYCKSSGLLNDVVMEGIALCYKGKSKMDATIVIGREEEELADKRKIIEEPPLPPVGTSKEEETATIIATQSSSHQLISTEKNDNGGCNNNKEALNNSMPQMDDELLSILKNCPIYSPVRKWYKVDDDEDSLMMMMEI
ncbi:transcription factor MYB101-like [Arachis stenosperma]|uniref:transcription factor MYB101-like n=1 Tax=Arachis stenosperma TaxID=217475 RepID=UPI0025ACA037|nr:transcription factor MYB101-like [Arachis stenosperma]